MKVLRKKLKNGISVVMEKRELPVVSLAIVNRAGASLESSKIKGIAHVIEHLVFTGTKTRTHEDISREIEKKGGILNAFTANEVTSFWFKLPSEHVFAGLDILVDMLKNPLFDAKKFEKEKKVVLEEIKMIHDDPARAVSDKVLANLYEAPFGEGIIGSEKTVSSLERDFVIKYYQDKYNHSDYDIIIVGNADFEKICSYLEKNFEKIERKIENVVLKKKNGESVEEREGIDQTHFIFAMHAPLVNDKDYVVLEVLDAYLASGMSSRLFLEIRENKGLAYAVISSIEAEKNYSIYEIYTGTKKEAIPEIKKIILDEFKKIDKMTEKNLEEAKERLIGLKKVSSEESARVMTELIFAEMNNAVDNYYKYEENVRKVTLAQVKKLASEIIKTYSTAAIVPK